MTLIFEHDFLSTSNLIFIASVACKYPVQNSQKIKFRNKVQKSISWTTDFKNQVQGKFSELQILLTKIVKKTSSFFKVRISIQGTCGLLMRWFPESCFCEFQFFYSFSLLCFLFFLFWHFVYFLFSNQILRTSKQAADRN